MGAGTPECKMATTGIAHMSLSVPLMQRLSPYRHDPALETMLKETSHA